METVTRHMKKDIKLIGKFTEVWCSGKRHQPRQPFALPGDTGLYRLCTECADFLDYAVTKRLRCPLEAEKPSCKKCRIHCYAAAQRAKVKEIMAWSGRRLILRGRLDYLYHYLF